MKKLLIFIAAMLVPIVAAGCASPKEKLRAACDGADRVVVRVNVDSAERGTVDLPSCEVSGVDNVASLFDAIDLETEMHPWCKCLGDMRIEFYEDQQLLAKLSVHHGDRLRWWDGEWTGQAQLTDQSIAAIDAWLAANNCPTIAKAREICQGNQAASQAAATPDRHPDGE